MNKVVLIGRLTADPEIYTYGDGKILAKYTLAVDRNMGGTGERQADFIPCAAFGKGGEFARKYLHKGMKIAVEGRINVSRYIKDDGTTAYSTEVIVATHEFCEKKADATVRPANGQEFRDIPDDWEDGDFPY